jgi:hypothetical protein
MPGRSETCIAHAATVLALLEATSIAFAQQYIVFLTGNDSRKTNNSDKNV